MINVVNSSFMYKNLSRNHCSKELKLEQVIYENSHVNFATSENNVKKRIYGKNQKTIEMQ